MTSIRKALKKIQDEKKHERDEIGSLARSEVSGASEYLPSIGDVPKDNSKLHMQTTAPRVRMDFARLCDSGLYPPVDQQREIADEFRLIKRPLVDNASGKGAYLADDANLIMITSPLPGDGKTFSCLNLALSLATEKDRSVLLVDADVAKPHISQTFELEERPGLIDLLLEPKLSINDTILATDVNNLWLLPAGREDEHATELLASDRMAGLVQALTGPGSDRIVVFDSPPLLATSESRVLAKSMGQIVLIVCAGKTSQDAVIEAASSLDMSKPVSVVLNQSTQSARADFYGYGYGYGSRRYGSGVDKSRRR